jgi:hypothetical protein
VTDGATGCHAVSAPASVILHATGNGQQQWIVPVDVVGRGYAITIDATVSNFDSGSGCDLIPKGSGPGVATALLLTAAAVLLGARRRTRPARR